ncbi:MAG TPA: riboflavin synthase [Gemmatimonadaceae bacterium]|jgi:riboflavin synthase, alpha subunit
MFTGLIDDIGIIESARDTAPGRELRVDCRYADLVEGESIAINGACLTVRECGEHWFTTAAVLTTLGRTTIASWEPGRRVNLERSLRVGDRMGGHIVQGHVDGLGVVESVSLAGDARLVDVRLPGEVAELMVPRGSLTVDGVSLTVNELTARDMVQLSLIAYTLDHTTLGDLTPGSRVHVEADVVGKYVRHLLAPHMAQV